MADVHVHTHLDAMGYCLSCGNRVLTHFKGYPLGLREPRRSPIDEDNDRDRDIALRPARASGGPFPLRRPVGPCPCACNDSPPGFCGGCGHAGCSGGINVR